MAQASCRYTATMPILRLLCSAILAATVAGCANTPKTKGIPWWPQGPGTSSDDLLRTAEANVVQSVAHTDLGRTSSTQPAKRFDQAVRYGDLLFVPGQIANVRWCTSADWQKAAWSQFP